MSHELKEHDQQHGRNMAWHGLTVVNPDLSLADCWLNDWEYTPKTVQVNGKDTPFAVLGVSDVEDLFIGRPYVRKTFKPVLNVPLIAKVTEAIGDFGLTLESCGTIMNRSRLFLSFGMKDARFEAAGRDFVSFLNIGNGNDMSCPLWVNTSNICTVCNNTFTANLGSAGEIMRMKKTQFSDFKLSQVGDAIKAMLKGQQEFAKTLNELAAIACDANLAREFFAGFVGNIDKPLSTKAENTVDRLVELFHKGAGNDGNDFSDVFQAATDFYTHEAANGQDDNAARWKNFVSSEFGAGKNNKIRAWAGLTDAKMRGSLVKFGKKILKLTADAAKAAETAK